MKILRFIPIFGLGIVVGVLGKYMDSSLDVILLAIGLCLIIGPLLGPLYRS